MQCEDFSGALWCGAGEMECRGRKAFLHIANETHRNSICEPVRESLSPAPTSAGLFCCGRFFDRSSPTPVFSLPSVAYGVWGMARACWMGVASSCCTNAAQLSPSSRSRHWRGSAHKNSDEAAGSTVPGASVCRPSLASAIAHLHTHSPSCLMCHVSYRLQVHTASVSLDSL